MNTIDKNQDTILEDTTTTLATPDADARNDNGDAVATPDTTGCLTHPELVDTIRGTLVNKGRRGSQLDDDLVEVQTRALEAARKRRMPAHLGEWKALCATIAARYVADLRDEAMRWAKYDAGLCEDPDEHVMVIEHDRGRDPVDTKRLIGVLKAQFEAGDMPEQGEDILVGVADGLSQTEIAEETGLTERQVEYRLGKMRALFAARLAELGMLALLVVIGALAAIPIAGTAANDDGRIERDPEVGAPTVMRLVTREERARALRREGMEACAAEQWELCLARLDDASEMDPAGDGEEGVQAARARAEERVESEERVMRAKPR
jgi:hypothetical protein